jgi:hypothetical protein
MPTDFYQPDQFQPVDAEAVLNSVALVQVSYFDLDGETLLNERKVYGEVLRVDEDGVEIHIANSKEIFTLPASLSAWKRAPKGNYQDEKTGAEIVDPGFLVVWKVFRTQGERRDGDHEWWRWDAG